MYRINISNPKLMDDDNFVVSNREVAKHIVMLNYDKTGSWAYAYDADGVDITKELRNEGKSDRQDT